MKTMNDIRQSQAGFTLTEAVIVTMAGIIMAAMAFPLFSGSFRSWQLAADTRSIATSLVFSKLKAVSQSTRYRVAFDIAANGWILQKFNRSTGMYENEGASSKLSSGLGGSGIKFRALASVSLPGLPAGSSTFIRFNSRGIPVDASGIPTASSVIYLTNGSADYAVSVSLVGRVEIWKYSGAQWIQE